MKKGKSLQLEGLKFNKLTVLERVEDYIVSNGDHLSQWLCLCDCGNLVIAKGSHIKTGKTKSCGCALQDHLTKLNMNRKGHIRKPNKYDLSGDYGIGYTSKGEEFYFDLEDYEKIKKICWVVGTGGYITGHIPGENRNIEMQRYVMGVTEHDICVDHIITENKNDNRKQNLRLTTKKENNINRKMMSNNKSGVIGVHWDKRVKKWKAAIGLNRKTIVLGYYEDINEATRVRKEAEIKYFGEYRYKGKEI